MSTGETAAGSEATGSETTARIVRAATVCFDRWGVQKVTMGDIAAEARMQRPHLYRYFSSKEALIATVIVQESRSLSEDRLRRFRRRGRASSLFLRALVHGQERLAANEFTSYAVRDPSGLAARLLAADSDFLEAESIWWDPALDYGRSRGEVREDLLNAEIIRWFLFSQLAVFERRDVLQSPKEVEHHLATFVVPAILSRPDAGPAS